jgi:hypothetical protein
MCCLNYKHAVAEAPISSLIGNVSIFAGTFFYSGHRANVIYNRRFDSLFSLSKRRSAKVDAVNRNRPMDCVNHPRSFRNWKQHDVQRPGEGKSKRTPVERRAIAVAQPERLSFPFQPRHDIIDDR